MVDYHFIWKAVILLIVAGIGVKALIDFRREDTEE